MRLQARGTRGVTSAPARLVVHPQQHCAQLPILHGFRLRPPAGLAILAAGEAEAGRFLVKQELAEEHWLGEEAQAPVGNLRGVQQRPNECNWRVKNAHATALRAANCLYRFLVSVA